MIEVKELAGGPRLDQIRPWGRRRFIEMGRAKALVDGKWERNAAAITTIAVGAAWLAWLMGPSFVAFGAALTYGPICSHAAPFGAHCPACYAAVALIGLGMALGFSGRGNRSGRN